MTVRLLQPAQAELDEAVSFYNEQSKGLGDAFLVEVLRVIDRITRYPDAWHPLSRNIRRSRLSRFPYGIVYTTIGDDILVIAVAHGHRRPRYWRDRLGSA